MIAARTARTPRSSKDGKGGRCASAKLWNQLSGGREVDQDEWVRGTASPGPALLSITQPRTTYIFASLTYIHTYLPTHLTTYMPTYLHTHKHTLHKSSLPNCLTTRVRVHLYACTRIHIHANLCMQEYAIFYTCICVLRHAYAYTHMHIHFVYVYICMSSWTSRCKIQAYPDQAEPLSPRPPEPGSALGACRRAPGARRRGASGIRSFDRSRRSQELRGSPSSMIRAPIRKADKSLEGCGMNRGGVDRKFGKGSKSTKGV